MKVGSEARELKRQTDCADVTQLGFRWASIVKMQRSDNNSAKSWLSYLRMAQNGSFEASSNGGDLVVEKNWYALAVQPRKENFVERQLLSAGVNATCPRYRKTVRHARTVKSVLAPFFPGYLFVELDAASQKWRKVNWVRGSIGLIKFDNRPARLSTEFVRSFISNLDSSGIVQFTPDLKVGARVQAIGGPFDQLSGEVIDLSESDRVKILMDALNRKVETTLPRTSLVVAA